MKQCIQDINGKQVKFRSITPSRFSILRSVTRQLKEQGAKRGDDYYIEGNALHFGSQFLPLPKQGAHEFQPATLVTRSKDFYLQRKDGSKLYCDSAEFVETPAGIISMRTVIESV